MGSKVPHPKPRKQHWLPCAYLQFFDLCGKPAGRDSRIYCADSKSCFEAKVGNIAAENYFYSRADPLGAEATFYEEENDYPKLIDEIVKNGTLRDSEFISMVIQVFTLHLRTCAYENRTSEERIDAYNTMNKTFVQRQLADFPSQADNKAGLYNHLMENWKVLVVNSPKVRLITSDHPVVLFGDNRIRLGFLPVTPLLGVIIYDIRKVLPVNDTIPAEDASKLNAVQCNHCHRHIYSNYNIQSHPSDWQAMVQIMNREKPIRYVDQDESCFGVAELSSAKQCGFSFVRF